MLVTKDLYHRRLKVKVKYFSDPKLTHLQEYSPYVVYDNITVAVVFTIIIPITLMARLDHHKVYYFSLV